ncbi:MAG TPA: methyltransferase domain-containing protein [Candidatus Dormibacteraeota bacterium]|nr:methyltransferase domain-containing protein [Candidatus Dormibacteraeota bacterium]
MAAGRTAGEGAERLVERFLAGWSHRTRQAYATDLQDFARVRGKTLADAVADLLESHQQGRRLILDFAVELRRRGRGRATVQRRLGTLSSLAEMAGELGVVEWSLEVPSDEEVASAAQARQGGDVAYFLPRNEAEIDRLDVQHYALQERLGANYLAPLEQPARILDVGCGTGLWAYELSAKFPDAHVIGFDLEVSKRPWPPTYRFVRGNLLQGLPFADGRFDFVHQRFLMAGIPVKDWARTMTELVRVTRPHGWLELVEMEFDIAPAGQATRRVFEMAWRLGRNAGLDTTGIIFRSLGERARRAGLIDVETREGTVSIGEWGGRIGSMMATDFRALFIRTAGLFEKVGVSEQEFLELVTAAQQEWEEHHSLSRFTVAMGRKPG